MIRQTRALKQSYRNAQKRGAASLKAHARLVAREDQHPLQHAAQQWLKR